MVPALHLSLIHICYAAGSLFGGTSTSNVLQASIVSSLSAATEVALGNGDDYVYKRQGFQLDRALVGDSPVSRGICHVVNGHLTDIWERRQVHTFEDGYVSEDGESPVFLEPNSIVSMNLWGFQPAMWPPVSYTHLFASKKRAFKPLCVLERSPMAYELASVTAAAPITEALSKRIAKSAPAPWPR